MSSTYGEQIKLSIFGQSHGAAIGMTLDGVPAGLPINTDELQLFMNRRAPGTHDYDTPRKETDIPEFLSGIVDSHTCGAPIAAIIRNSNTRSSDYDSLKNCPRPGHADYTAQVKYGGFHDAAGGGHFSGRLTAPLCIAGGLCLQWLKQIGIHIGAHIASIRDIQDTPNRLDWTNPDFDLIEKNFPVVNMAAGKKMQDAILHAKALGDSVGGTIECIINGIPAGLGGAMFGGIESKLAQILYGIPAVKGLDFGTGFSGSTMTGSQNNDSFVIQNEKIATQTNHAGGILGGITTGMPVVFRVAIKPTPSIAIPQTTVNLQQMTQEEICVGGRHDPCIVPRAVPVIEAAAAIAIFDIILSSRGADYGLK